MELVSEDSQKKVFMENNTVYTMLDMGDYVGYMAREYYDQVNPCWKLQYVVEEDEQGKSLKVDGLTDYTGQYIRFIIDENQVRRIIQIDNGKVFSDLIIDYREDKSALGFGPRYFALNGDINSSEKYLLDDYVKEEHSFEEYDGIIPSINHVANFIEKNTELKRIIDEEHRAR